MSDLASSTSPRAEALLGGGPSRPSRGLRLLALALIVCGALVLLDAVVTLLWQEPITWLYATIRQDSLDGTLRASEHALPTAAEKRVLASIPDEQSRIAWLARREQAETPDGGPVGRIVIPSIGASFVVVKGTDTEDLKSGPGIYSETSFPGSGGTTAIAGHRTTYLAPFRHIDALQPGQAIRLQMPYAQFNYAVLGQRVVSPNDVQAAVAQLGYSRLVLSACTPLFSAEKRLLVYARLVTEEPRGASLLLPGGEIPHTIAVRAGPRRLPPVLESLQPEDVAPLG